MESVLPGDVRVELSAAGLSQQDSPFPAPLALDVIPLAGSLGENGWSSEELKIRNESRRILDLPELRVSATCAWVPVLTTHSVAVHAVFDKEVTVEQACEVLSAQPSVLLVDHTGLGGLPTPVEVVGGDPTHVGRV